MMALSKSAKTPHPSKKRMRSDDEEEVLVMSSDDEEKAAEDNSGSSTDLLQVDMTHLDGDVTLMVASPKAKLHQLSSAAYQSEVAELRPLLRLAWVRRGHRPSLAELLDVDREQFIPVAHFSSPKSVFHVVALLHLQYDASKPLIPVGVTQSTTLSFVLLMFMSEWRRLEGSEEEKEKADEEDLCRAQLQRVRLYYDDERKRPMNQSPNCCFLLIWAVQGFSPTIGVEVLEEGVAPDDSIVLGAEPVQRPFSLTRP